VAVAQAHPGGGRGRRLLAARGLHLLAVFSLSSCGAVGESPVDPDGSEEPPQMESFSSDFYGIAGVKPQGWLETYPFSVAGGPPGDLLEVEGLGYSPDLPWSPDGEKIVYTLTAGARIMLGSLGTGRSVPLATGLSPDARFSSVAWSPDGQRIAFGASWPRENEFWLISDFLPEGR
jgi:WD40 repeat protein